MSELNTISKTLYIPLLGRIYASQHQRDILYDKAALAIADKLPKHIRNMPGQTEYTSLASAVRSKNTDHYIQMFLSKNPNGIIVNIGCGLETIYERNDNGHARWFELDLPEVLQCRSMYLPEKERDRYLPYSMFDYKWIDIVKASARNSPIMLIASGLFLYFSEEQIIEFIRHLKSFNDAQLLFDAVSPKGLKISRYYVDKMDHREAEMLFSIKTAKTFAAKISSNIIVTEERKFYSLTKRDAKLKLAIKGQMFFSDIFNIVKIILLKIN